MIWVGYTQRGVYQLFEVFLHEILSVEKRQTAASLNGFFNKRHAMGCPVVQVVHFIC